MFKGEFEGLKAILNTRTILVPEPIATGHTEDNSKNFILLKYMPMTTFTIKGSVQLGRQLADFHLHNLRNSKG